MSPALAVQPNDDADSALRRELYFFTLYRLLEGSLLVLVLFGPVTDMLEPPRHDLLARVVALSYLFLGAVLFAFGRRGELRGQALVGICCDLLFGILAIHAIPVAGTGIALMLLFNVGAAALLLPPRLGLGAAMVAVVGIVGEHFWAVLLDESERAITEPLMFSVGYLAVATTTSILGRQMRDSYELAETRGVQTAHLTEVNELIIRRLRTGVLLVDGQNRVQLANEAALLLLGEAGDGHRDLALALPELSRRLAAWRESGVVDDGPLQVATDQNDVIPRFTRLLAGSDQTLVFLDDTSLLSRRAESMTLATLGRFSASLAHEIRNPLAAINYAVQLLEESDDIAVSDRRLLEIIRQQGQRMNGIVENVLGLARREPASPDYVDLVALVNRFVNEYRAGHPLENDTLVATSERPEVQALVDPRHLLQVLTVLVHNALTYGRMPGEPARVSVHVHQDDRRHPIIDVTDRGPGIPERVAQQLFQPFFTTSGHGTGLGLYIARELILANQASLDFIALPAGGSCFRIRLSSTASIRRDRLS
ncbi:sensor histidine kinase [Novilysobacter avium]|uniref:histidine kinase n=1 Tax=Novilysobacter avium TaxID=2781023 RepID=A0A7S6ZVV2_9GAMM|nr:HAMP domain-containing sensor histidine kinase [Lysobacter avium]QOW22559.1 HAMP domain-containing histidine kinase [Lysobacter avium]